MHGVYEGVPLGSPLGREGKETGGPEEEDGLADPTPQGLWS